MHTTVKEYDGLVKYGAKCVAVVELIRSADGHVKTLSPSVATADVHGLTSMVTWAVALCVVIFPSKNCELTEFSILSNSGATCGGYIEDVRGPRAQRY